MGDETNNPKREEVFIKEMKYKLVETSPDRTEFMLQLDDKIQNQEYRYEFAEMGEMIQYRPISSNNNRGIKFQGKNPYILEFDIDPQDRGFTHKIWWVDKSLYQTYLKLTEMRIQIILILF